VKIGVSTPLRSSPTARPIATLPWLAIAIDCAERCWATCSGRPTAFGRAIGFVKGRRGPAPGYGSSRRASPRSPRRTRERRLAEPLGERDAPLSSEWGGRGEGAPTLSTHQSARRLPDRVVRCSSGRRPPRVHCRVALMSGRVRAGRARIAQNSRISKLQYSGTHHPEL
jgi:hypothetical protein